MLAEKRRGGILDILNSRGAVQVRTLARHFGVSEMTIRRDLESLHGTGLRRCHGGAVLKPVVSETSYAEKSVAHTAEKRLLAEYCATLTSPGDTVFLDAGTTCHAIAEAVKELPDLTVVTNDLSTALLLCESRVRLVVIGGEAQNATRSTIGALACGMLETLRVNLAFFGAASINASYDVATPTPEKASVKRMALRNTERAYLVVDSSKFFHQALCRICSLADFTAVVTTRSFTAAEKNVFQERGIDMRCIEDSSLIKKL